MGFANLTKLNTLVPFEAVILAHMHRISPPGLWWLGETLSFKGVHRTYLLDFFGLLRRGKLSTG